MNIITWIVNLHMIDQQGETITSVNLYRSLKLVYLIFFLIICQLSFLLTISIKH